MADNEVFIENTLILANTIELVRQTINKVGLEFISPLDPAVQDEQISKAIQEAKQ